MKFVFAVLILVTGYSGVAQDYALDDAHNHDGTHVEGQNDCGSNYMFPGDIARLGSHSFLILGEDGPEHLLLDHRSGTPPHTYQFILRVRVDANEMATYRRLLKETKVALPAVTTIYFDKTGKQVDRTFFCLPDLKKIFGSEQNPNDVYSKLFPIRASWQKDADFEGAFPIKETVVPEDPLNGEVITDFPTSTEAVSKLEPVIEMFPGWKTDITQVKSVKDLPLKAMNYLNFIQQHVGCPIDVVSVGPDREQTLWIKPLYNA